MYCVRQEWPNGEPVGQYPPIFQNSNLQPIFNDSSSAIDVSELKIRILSEIMNEKENVFKI